MSDTPRTDMQWDNEGMHMLGTSQVVSAAFARQLERELADAHGVAQACKARAEKAEARVRELEAALIAIRDCTDLHGWGSTVAASA